MKTSRHLATAIFLGVLFLAASVHAQTESIIGGTGTVLSGSFSYNAAGNTITIAGSSTETRILYNISNPKDTGSPAWTTLEMLATDGGSFSTASAKLIRVPRTTGSPETTLCTANSTTGTTPAVYTCTFSSSLVDFANYYYYVRVSLTRQSLSEFPAITALRVF